ncbi:MAG: choice-of-anchor D domain-containing protein, partial [Bacteroidota bacterium]|nr:choice-of-anchor D domain-containing protein [Bacteroidota bacterium]
MKHIYYSISIIFTLLFAGRVQAQNIMKLGNVSVQAGQEATLDISVDNTVPFVAFQVDIPIPDGLTYVASSAVLDDARKEDHTLSASIVAPNTLRLIGYSLGSLQFKGNSGAVAHFKLKAGALPGNYLLTLTNPIIGDATSANILTSSVNGTVTILSPHIQLSVASMDFGRVALLQTSDRNVTITNTGNQPLQVTGITFTNPQFTAIGGSPFTLDANGTKSVTVRFTSQTKGTYKETMSVASNDPAKPITIDTLKAVAFAVNELHAGSMTALSGQTKTLDFTINNMEPFTAFQFDIPLPSTMQYVTGSAALLRTTDHMVSCNLLTGNILRVVAYSPSNTPFTGTGGKVLSLDFKIMGQAGWYPININNGIISDVAGLNAMSQSYNGSLQVSAPQISTVQQLSYGDVSTLSSKTLNLRVYNYGGDVLNINQLTFSDPAFSSAQALPLSIPTGGQYKDIPVTFTKSSKGTVSTTLKINSNDPVKNPFIVNLSANAFAPNYISVKDFNGCPGTDVVVTIDVDNVEDFVAMQCDLKYPSCLTPKTSAIVLTDRKGDHSLQSNLLGNNTIRLVAFSMT